MSLETKNPKAYFNLGNYFYEHGQFENAKFNIRLYSIGENGEPKNPIYEKNIIGIVKKGTKNIELDLSELDIMFPKNGVFISYEWLIIPENEFKASFPIKDSKKRIKKIKSLFKT